ncbi:MAG: DUF1554 domain-containing protein [Leptonema illini]|uniref:DUF1554 domain-containing protein n=1 Tax=Leptonema illini TaxID=183 RepID=A0A833LWL3_9LEPT|nr:MAG: DUF1554 domain-containing protein [Leptonema illini]
MKSCAYTGYGPLTFLAGIVLLFSVSCTRAISDRIPEFFLFDAINPPLYSISGAVSGLAMNGLVLSNSGDSVQLNSPASEFVFHRKLRTDTPYNIVVSAYPRNEEDGSQYCTVAGGSGTIGNGDVSGVHVNCSDAVTLLVNVQPGLIGTGMVLLNRGADPLTINGEISTPTRFAFRTPVVATDPVYAVTVGTQPVNPHQTCSVTDGADTYSGGFPGEIITPSVSCITNRYAIRVNVTGLKSGNTLVIKSDFGTYPAETGLESYPATSAGSETIAVTANGISAPFATKIRSGDSYGLAIDTQATGQNCTIGTPSASVTSYDIVVPVNCATNSYPITGEVTGYEGSTPLQIRITANGTSQTINYSTGSTFTSTAIPYGSAFEMRILTNPQNKWQTCSIVDEGNSNGSIVSSGAVDAMGQTWDDRLTDASMHLGSAISGIEIECVTNTFTVGGAVTGYAAGAYSQKLQLQNGAETLTIEPGSTSFVFVTPVASGASFGVTLLQPPVLDNEALNCSVSGGSGTMAGANVSGVSISCSLDRTIRVTVTGFGISPAGNFTLNPGTGGPSASVTANGDYYFSVKTGQTYSFNTPSPANQTCTWSNPSLISGTVTSNLALSLDCSPIVMSTSVDDNDATLKYDMGAGPIEIKFNKDMSSTIAAAGTSTDCSQQGIQISMVKTGSTTEVPLHNNFVGCVPLQSVSVSGNIVTVAPHPDYMWYEATYKIRINNSAVVDAGNTAMAYVSGSYQSTTGFNTGRLVRWYNSGNSTDSSRANISLSGTVQPATGSDGDAGGSLSFSASYLSASASGLPAFGESRTVCQWVRLTDLPPDNTNKHLVSYGSDTTDKAFGIGIRRQGGMQLRFFGGADRDDFIAHIFHRNAWTHICVVYDGDQTKLLFYVNGALIGTADRSNAPLATNVANFYLSGWVSGLGGITGMLDNVRIYAAVLPDRQIRYLATQVPDGLVGRWDLVSNGGESPGKDVSGWNRDLQTSGTAIPGVDRFGLSSAIAFGGGRLDHAGVATNQTAGITLGAWIFPKDYGNVGVNTIVLNGHSSSGGYELYIDGTSQRLCFLISGFDSFCSTVTIPLNVWTHVTLVSESPTVWKLYVNGAAAGNFSVTTVNTPVSGVYIGRNQSNDEAFFGSISDVRIYERALLQSEIQALVQQPNKIVKLTASGWTGNLGGISGADTKCGEGFKAMLVSNNNDRRACTSANCTTGGITEHRDWVLRPNITYLNPDGNVLFTANWNGVFAFGTLNAQLIGSNPTYVWTGFGSSSWTTISAYDTCNNWTVAEADGSGYANASLTDSEFIRSGTLACNATGLRLYCVEQ